MKLRELVVETALIELRKLIADNFLFESVSDHLAVTIAKLKNKDPSKLFNGSPDGIDLDHLALILTGLNVLGNTDYRDAMTKEDIGIDPKNAQELFKLLDEVAKVGKDPEAVTVVFDKIKEIAPKVYTKKRAELDDLKSKDEAVRNQEIKKLEAYMHKVTQSYQKLKTSVAQRTSAK
jgi:hypothetical protein